MNHPSSGFHMKLITILILSSRLLYVYPLLNQSMPLHENYPLYKLETEILLNKSESDELYLEMIERNDCSLLKSYKKYFVVNERLFDEKLGVDGECELFRDEYSNIIYSIPRYTDELNHRILSVSNNGNMLVSRYDSETTLAWLSQSGAVLNKLELNPDQNAGGFTLKNGSRWHIRTYYSNGNGNDENPEKLNLTTVYFSDQDGNILNYHEMIYPRYYNETSVSRNGEYIFMSCYKKNKNKRIYHSYLFTSEGILVKEYPRQMLSKGYFSEDGSIYICYSKVSKLIDTETGDIIASIRTSEPPQPADKNTNTITIIERNKVKIMNYKSQQLLFDVDFPSFREMYNVRAVNISCDAKKVKVLIDKTLFTFIRE